MNKSHALPIALLVLAFAPDISIARDLDAPGPGYRQQIEQLSSPGDQPGSFRSISRSVRVRVDPHGLLNPPVPKPQADFSKPIRLSITVMELKEGPVLDESSKETPKKPE